MKAVIYNWAGSKKVSEYLESKMIKHNTESEVDFWDIVQDAYNAGFSVQIRPGELILLDDKNFGQR